MKCSQYIGRIGGLAIALGIGAAIGQGCAVASADDSGAVSSHHKADAGTSRQTSAHRATATATSRRPASSAAAAGPLRATTGQPGKRPTATTSLPTTETVADLDLSAPEAVVRPAVHVVKSALSGVRGVLPAPTPPPVTEQILLAFSELGRRHVGAIAPEPAAAVGTLKYSEFVNSYYYGTDSTGTTKGAYLYQGSGEPLEQSSVSEPSTITYTLTTQPFTLPVIQNGLPKYLPSSDFDVYMLKLDMYGYETDKYDNATIIGVRKMAPGIPITVERDPLVRDGSTNYAFIAVRKGIDLPELDGIPAFPVTVPVPPDPGGPGGETGLTAPTLVTRDVTAHSIKLAPDPDGTDDVRVVGYNIYRDGVKVNEKLVSTIFTYTDEDLDADVTYTYTARSVDADGIESVDSNALKVTTLSDAEDPGFFEKLRIKLIDLFVPAEDGQNNPFEVFIEATHNLVSIIPGAGAVFDVVAIPIDLAQLVLASIQGDRADVDDEINDLGHDLLNAIGLVNSEKFLKAVSEST